MQNERTLMQSRSEKLEEAKPAKESANHQLIMGSWAGDHERFWKHVEIRADHQCWEWLAGINSDGYATFSINGNPVRANRVSFYIKHRTLNPELMVCHSCDNRSCVNPSHLFEGTGLDNSKDCISKNRQSRGTDRPLSKLSEANVAECRKLFSLGNVTMQSLANKFGVSRPAIAMIVKRKTWKHI